MLGDGELGDLLNVRVVEVLDRRPAAESLARRLGGGSGQDGAEEDEEEDREGEKARTTRGSHGGRRCTSEFGALLESAGEEDIRDVRGGGGMAFADKIR